MSLQWKVDECAVYFDRLHLRGWCWHPAQPIVGLEVIFPAANATVAIEGLTHPSPDVAAAVHPAAHHCRFDAWLPAPREALGRDFSLRFTLADGAMLLRESAFANAFADDPFFLGWERFLAHLRAMPSGAVLEMGSRARSAITHRHRIPPQLDYVGLDLLPGPNVDIVGDAHELRALFGAQRFVAAFSLSVFEHLAMPWKVALELNHVLAPGGLVYTSTHQTWPMHEEPWDFWRFSRHSWQTIFHPVAGFEVLETAVGEPARIHATRTSPATRDLPDNPAWLGSACLARKTAETALTWPVSLQDAARGNYPAGELAAPPN